MTDQDQRAGAIPERPLGRTGVKVSALGLGGHHLGKVQAGRADADADLARARLGIGRFAYL